MLYRILSVKPMDDYSLFITFEDGLSGIVSIKDSLYGPMFEPLKNVKFFRSVFLGEHGEVCWPNGADLAPDALYAELLANVQSIDNSSQVKD